MLSHTAGLPFLDGVTSAADCYDWDAFTARLAVQAPAWESRARPPGTTR